MDVSSVIDWLEITKPDFRCLPKDFVPAGDGWKVEEVLSAAKHYDFAGRCQNGSIVMYGSTEKQGMRLICSGEPMKAIRASGTNDLDMVRFAHRDGRRVTRIDLTIDMVGNDAPSPEKFREAIEKDEVKTRARSFENHDQIQNDAQTVYIGSKTSDKRARVYNYRAKHLNVLWDVWTRFELQLMQDYARAAAQDIMRHGVRDTACVHSKAFCDFPSIPEYQLATNPEISFEPKRVPRKVTNWEKWLLETVISSCDRAIGTQRESVVREFHDTLTAMLNRDMH